MIVPDFDLQLQFKYMNYFMYTSHHVFITVCKFFLPVSVVLFCGLRVPSLDEMSQTKSTSAYFGVEALGWYVLRMLVDG